MDAGLLSSVHVGFAPLVIGYQGAVPSFGSAPQCGGGAVVAGRTTLGNGAILEPFAVLRADGHFIEVGDRLYLGERSSVHIAHDTLPARMGSDVTVGKNSVVHACTIGDHCAIGHGVVVLDGATIGEGSVVADGSVVFSRTVLPPGSWCEGSPAVAVRPLAAGELEAAHDRIRSRAGAAACSAHVPLVQAETTRGYLAPTVSVMGAGTLTIEEGGSAWFGGVLDLGRSGITIAEGANVQDNSILHCVERAITVGRNATIGHNVLMVDCTIGESALVGMGSTLAPGTVVMPDAMVAAGTRTEPGQVLESNWLWAGRPARPVSKMNARWTDLIARTASTYREYAAEYAAQWQSSAPRTKT